MRCKMCGGTHNEAKGGSALTVNYSTSTRRVPIHLAPSNLYQFSCQRLHSQLYRF